MPLTSIQRIIRRCVSPRWWPARPLTAALALPVCLVAAGNVAPDLPAYAPRPVAIPVHAGYVLPDGSVQIVGFGDMAGIVARWNQLFERSHPGVHFHFVRSDDLAALQALTYDATAVAPVGCAFLRGAQGPYKILVKAPPFGIRVARASLNRSAAVSPFAIVVPQSNPLDHLTAAQVVRIFTVGDRRSALTWWRQLGVAGGLGAGEIHPWGLPPTTHYPSEDPGFAAYFEWGQFGGSPPAWAYRSAPTYAKVAQDVARDPQAIGITSLNQVTARLKVLAVSANDWSAPSRGTAADLARGAYPYDRSLYVYARRLPGKPLDPLVHEYLRLILSRDGQQAVADDPLGYRPLSATEAAIQRAKLR